MWLALGILGGMMIGGSLVLLTILACERNVSTAVNCALARLDAQLTAEEWEKSSNDAA